MYLGACESLFDGFDARYQKMLHGPLSRRQNDTKSNAENLASILQNYCQWSGQLINQAKSILMLTPNIHKSLIRHFTNCLKVKYQADLGKYLGVPVQWGRVIASTFADLTDKFINRMQGWKSTSLTFAGRTTLLKAALDPVSNHLMTVLKLPMKITKLLNIYKREFLWKHRKGEKKFHSIGWDTVCQPVENGGLGIRDLHLNNLALLARMAWRIHSQQESGRDILIESLRWCIGNGENINFWNDPWFDNLPLSSIIVDQAHIDHTLLVKDVIDKNGPRWNLSLCANDLSSSVQKKIQSIVIPVSPFAQDSLVWQLSKFGDVVTLIPFLLWHIWLARNELVFKSTPFRSLFVLGKAYRVAEEYQFSILYRECSKNKQEMFISWKPLAAPYIKLNSDGVASSLAGAGVGGVMRDSEGQFLACFANHIYRNGNIVAEIQAIRQGLLLAIQLGYSFVEVESDSAYTVQLCRKLVPSPWYLKHLVEDIHFLVKFFGNVVFTHMYR
ncbi:uncharacterized protein LOC113311918 [Papaver somniferum]|uniref:uncharacterized protein LOC113311918 n=1 Tax=Papaver somniferum TaxID=3469 RepID=UPI000E6FBA51|nr:uncharacterized protein LOC113311918 [Papaver somniferum]